MSVRRSDKQTLAVIVHTINIVMKIALSYILLSFGFKKQTSTLAAYGIANIVLHKKNNA